MRITAVSVRNYKSFSDAGEAGRLTLTAGINVVVGQNNAGKTALLEALTLRLKAVLHRSLVTHPHPGAVVQSVPTAEVDFQLEEREFLELVADGAPDTVFQVHSPQGSPESAPAMLSRLITPHCTLRCTQSGGGLRGSVLGLKQDGPHALIRVQRPALHVEGVAGGSVSDLGNLLAAMVSRRVYLFGAERFSIGDCAFGSDGVLAPNAQNLPQALNILQGNRDRFAHFNNLVHRVLPQVRWVSVLPVSNSFRILVWTIDPATQRTDLAVPLADCGTGIGQVLAILYVVLNADLPQVIAIDEPQSFLHPGAVRKLLEILREHPQHQFVLATHSPVALASTEPDTILFVRCTEGVSTVTSIDRRETKQTRLMLADLGVRLEDVFGADRILWVEGKTEELCFPVIVREIVNLPLAGTSIIGVLTTGDFETRHGDLAFELYRRLSESSLLMPSATAFVFDRERRTETAIADLTGRGAGKVAFLSRRMYENYLLNPTAIAAVATAIEGFGPVTPEAVSAWVEVHRWESELFGPSSVPDDRSNHSWRTKVSGAAVLKKLFSTLSETRVAYDKVRHGLALTEWLAANQPDELREVAQLLTRLIRPEM